MLWNLASLGILAVSGFLMLGLIERLYDAEALGQFQQVWGLYVFLSQAAVGGLDRSVLQKLAKHHDEPHARAAIAWGALLPGAGLAVLVALAFALFSGTYASWQGSPELLEGTLAAAPGLALFSVNKVLLGIVNGLQRMRAFAVYQALRYALMPVGVVVCQQAGLPGSRVAFLFTFAEGLLFLVLACEFLLTVGPRARGAWTWAPEHLRFGAKSVVSGMTLELNTRLDVIMLGYFLVADGPIGIYGLAIAVSEGCYQVLMVMQNNYNPVLARHLARGELAELAPVIARGRRVTWALMAAVGLVAVCGYPLGAEILMGNPEYRAGWAPFACLMAFMVLTAGWQPFAQVLLMGNRPGLHTLYMLGVLVANFTGNALLIPRYGLLGAALATGTSFLVSVVLLRILSARALGLRL